MRFCRRLFLLTAVLVFASSAAKADFLTNGDFATGDFTGWEFALDNFGGVMTTSVDNGPFGTGDSFNVTPATDTLDIEGGGFLTQEIVVSGGTYSYSLVLTSFEIEFQVASDTKLDVGLHFTRTSFNESPVMLHWADNLAVTQAVPEPGLATLFLASCLGISIR